MKKYKIITAVVAAGIVLGWFTSTYIFRLSSKNVTLAAESSLVAVEVQQAKKDEINQYMKFTGKTRGGEEEEISPKVSAKVTSLKVKEGDTVKADTILMTLDTTDIDEQVKKAKEAYEKIQAAYKSSQSQISSLQSKVSSLNKDISSYKSKITSLTNLNKNAQTKLSNLQASFNNGEISEASYNSQKNTIEEEIKNNSATISEYNKKVIELEASKAAIEKTIQSTGSMGDMSSQIEQLKQIYESTLEAKESYTIRSTISGTVKNLNVKVGEPAMSLFGSAMLITNMETMDFNIQVSKDYVKNFKKDQKVQVEVDSKSGMKSVEGIVKEVATSVDEKTNQYIVTVNVPNKDKQIELGNYASVMIPTQTKKNIITVDKNTLVREGDKTYVYVLNEGIAKRVEVKLGLENDTMVEIVSGVNAEDQVVVKGKEFIEDGQQVNVVRGNE